MTHGADVHIVPIGDLQKHDDGSRACWCQPRIETIDPRTGAPFPSWGALVIHHSADGRDLVEQHGLQ